MIENQFDKIKADKEKALAMLNDLENLLKNYEKRAGERLEAGSNKDATDSLPPELHDLLVQAKEKEKLQQPNPLDSLNNTLAIVAILLKDTPGLDETIKNIHDITKRSVDKIPDELLTEIEVLKELARS